MCRIMEDAVDGPRPLVICGERSGCRSKTATTAGTAPNFTLLHNLMNTMKTKFIRKLINDCGTGLVNIPKPIFEYWKAAGRTHICLVYDTELDSILVTPLRDDPLSGMQSDWGRTR